MDEALFKSKQQNWSLTETTKVNRKVFCKTGFRDNFA